MYQKLHLTCPFQDKLIVVAEALLDLITDPFTDIPKDVDGHDAHKGDIEEPSEEKEARAEDKDAGQPEADVTLGEKGLGSDRDTGDYRFKKMLQGVPLKY